MHRWNLVAFAVLCLALSTPAQDNASPLPMGTVGFFRVNVPALAASPGADFYIRVFQAADKDVLEAFLKRLPVSPESLRSITGIAWQDRPQAGLRAVVLVEFKAPVDLGKLAGTLGFPAPKSTPAGEVIEGPGLTILAQGDKTLLAGNTPWLKAYSAAPREKEGPWMAAWAGSASPMASVWTTTDLGNLPPKAEAAVRQAAGVFLQPLRGSRVLGLSLTQEGGNSVAAATVLYNDAASAKASLESWKLTLELARGLLKGGESAMALVPLAYWFAGSIPDLGVFGPTGPEVVEYLRHPLVSAVFAYLAGALAEMGEKLDKLPLNARGNAVTVSGKLSPAGLQSTIGISAVISGLMIPAVSRAREAAYRTRDSNKLKVLAIALHNYHDVHGHFPPAVVRDKAGKPLYSWRVLILPYLEQDALFKRWKLDEPWDSPNNKPLSDLALEVFSSSKSREALDNQTHYRVFTGKSAGFEDVSARGAKGLRLAEFTDGTSNTIAVVEAAIPVPWAKPDELEFDAEKPLPPLGLADRDGFNAMFFDGSVRYIPKGIAAPFLKAYITRNGGEVVPFAP